MHRAEQPLAAALYGGTVMSKFAAYLRELLDQRGEPISRVARNAGLERTSIHKALKYERLLP